mmetsp:Transcript_14957/g.39747  ORF Transcript_14957/g.39747 Transcript_14957/m.39747 type:complete len:401 (+) Transcript_14957:134-1336(+)
MRFGKKLALQVMEDSSGAPYLSHKPMKESINRTVRELRLYQARVQNLQGGHAVPVAGGNFGPNDADGSASPAELAERIREFDRQLFLIVDDDLAKILAYVRTGEVRISAELAQLQDGAMSAGILVQEAQLERLEKTIQNAPQDRAQLTWQLLQLRMRSIPTQMAVDLEGLGQECNELIEVVNQHAQYLEINVAGFRKLLKRHEKQIPLEFRSRSIPSLGFHRLVTHTSRELLDLIRQISAVVVDAQERLEKMQGPEVIARALQANTWTKLVEQRGLGPECEMVLNIQKQLKHLVNGQPPMCQDQSAASRGLGPSTMHLYPKPASQSGFPVAKLQAQQQARAQAVQADELLQSQRLQQAVAAGPYGAVPYQMAAGYGGPCGGGWAGGMRQPDAGMPYPSFR